MKVTQKCLRYIIPFTYQESFGELCNRIDTQKSAEWQRVYVNGKKTNRNGESDIYRYVRNEFRTENQENSVDSVKMGVTWAASPKAKKSLCKIRLLDKPIGKDDGKLPEGLDFSISDMGLILFRNCLGFFWYEINTENEMDVEKLIRFQNIFKELNRSKNSLFWEQKTEKEYVPFSMGNWVADKLEFLKPVYLPERKNAYKTMFLKSVAAAKHLKEVKCLEEEAQCMKCQPYVPDKALLFTYGAFGESEEIVTTGSEEETLAYYLTNGYKESYHCSEDVKSQMCKPFSNVIWYATQEGCSYLAWPDTINSFFFKKILPGKIKADYFTLYIKCLFQSYSLFLYAEKLQDSLSAEPGAYTSSKQSKVVTELFGEINLFLTKTMATSVSHIDHQNSFFVYVKKRLYITEDAASVTAGLDSLENLLREIQHKEETARWQQEAQEEAIRNQEEKERDLQMQRVMYLFSLLAIFSACADGFAFVEQFIPFNNVRDMVSSVPAMIAYGIVTLLIIVLSGMTIWHSVKFYIGSRKKGKRKDL